MNDWRRVHRLTPLLKFWTVLLAVLAVAVANVGLAELAVALTWLQEGRFLLLGAALGGFVVVCALVWFVSQVWWQAMGYRLGAEELSLRQGVLNKQLRTARYDRIQAVDVVESVIARIFGLASVRVETAGGGNSAIEVAYLRKREAEGLRVEVLSHARGEGQSAAADFSEAPHRGRVVVPEIPITRSLVAAALHGATILGALATVGLLISPLGWATIFPALLGTVPVVWAQIDRSWRFTASLSDDTLHLSYGLADRRQQAIPLERIHGVSLHQPLLWRGLGWGLVQVSVAGYGATSGRNAATTAILPVGSRDLAMALVELVGPVPLSALDLAPTYTSPKVARWVSPIDRDQQSVTVLDGAVLTRSGRFSRRLNLIAQSHIQELSLVRGPLQQLFGLCTVRFDLVPGPVRMAGEDLTPEDGRLLLEQLRQRSLPAYTPPAPST